MIPAAPALIAAARPAIPAIAPELVTAFFKRAQVARGTILLGRRVGDDASFFVSGTTSDTPRADDSSLFAIDGLTEAITGVLLADAVRRGEVRLDESVADLHDADFHPSPPLTLADLATHHSGFARIPLREPAQPYAGFDRAALAALVNAPRPAGAPAYAPSLADFALIGTLLADRAGTSFAGLVRDRVFVPLSMDVSVGDTGSDARVVPGRSITNKPAAPWRYDALAPAAGIRSSLGDLLRFAGEMFAGENGPLASDMQLAVIPRSPGLGLGWHIEADGRVWASGGSYGSTAFLGIDPKAHVAVAVLSNVGVGFGNVTFDDLGLRLLDDTVRGRTP